MYKVLVTSWMNNISNTAYAVSTTIVEFANRIAAKKAIRIINGDKDAPYFQHAEALFDDETGTPLGG